MEDLQGKGKLCDFVNGTSGVIGLAGTTLLGGFWAGMSLGCYIKTL